MAIEFYPSPHFNNRPPPGTIEAMVIHACACTTLAGLISWFENPDSKVSAHYSIDKNGALVQHVYDEFRAWHAGTSSWNGREGLNDWSIGVELVNLNTDEDEDPYPEEQYQATLALCREVCKRYGIHSYNVVAHYDVSPDRKTDPKWFNMGRLRQELETNST